MPSPDLKIGMIGCGKMGSAILHGFLKTDIAENYTIIKPSPLPKNLQGYKNISHYSNLEKAGPNLKPIDIIILAVKPQTMNEICNNLKPYIHPKTLIISIAAGRSIKQFEKHFGAEQPIIRAMPNTPSLTGEGITAICRNETASDQHMQWATTIFQSVGETIVIDEENYFHAITALSGSGPAYIFYMIEALTKAGEKAGLPLKLSEKLARQTVIGAAALAKSENTVSAETLRQNVTSPGGTTEAGLKILMDKRFQDILNETIITAKNRGEELDQI